MLAVRCLAEICGGGRIVAVRPQMFETAHGCHAFSRRAASGRTGGYPPIGVTVAMADIVQLQDLLQQVLAAAQQGRFDVAEAGGCYRKAVALASLNRAVAARPTYFEAVHNAGLVLRMLGRPAEAIPAPVNGPWRLACRTGKKHRAGAAKARSCEGTASGNKKYSQETSGRLYRADTMKSSKY